MKNYLLYAAALAGLCLSPAQSALAAPVSTATDVNFQESVLNSATPVVVDFYADWCGPCRSMGPAVENVAAKMGSAVKVVRVNVDASPQTANRYRINSIPAFRVFKGGKIVAAANGAMPEQQLSALVNQALK